MRAERSPGSIIGTFLCSSKNKNWNKNSNNWISVRFVGVFSDSDDVQREANKLLADYKFKLQKTEQDMSTLQATVARLESQVIRYKSAAEASEKVEDELKVEKRKLQREVRLHLKIRNKKMLKMK